MSEVVIDEGATPYGTRTRIHLATDTVIEQKTYDAEPILREAEMARQATEGQRWGDGKVVGKVPMAVYAQAIVIKDPRERHKFIANWLRENPKFVTFDKFLK
jgi:hypothetical protein